MRDAVGFDPGEVGVEQDFRADRGVGRGHAQPLEDGRGEPPQVIHPVARANLLGADPRQL